MCSSPVMFGGGTAIVYLGFRLFESAVKSPAASQRAYQPASMALGSYAVGIGSSVLMRVRRRRLGWSDAGDGSGSAAARRRGYQDLYYRSAHGGTIVLTP